MATSAEGFEGGSPLDRNTSPLANPGAHRFDILFYSVATLVLALLYLFVYADMPVYGDAWGYGYRTAHWIAGNGMPLIPEQAARGTAAYGHPAFFFWLWALMMNVLGNTVRTAHLLPAVFSLLAVAGTYRLGRKIGGKALGVACGTALLVSPLFLAQAFRPLPIAAAMAGCAWSLFFFSRKRYFTASLLCAFAVMMREQALLLAVSYILVELYTYRFRNPARLLLLASPLLVLVLHGLGNFLVNGSFSLGPNRMVFPTSFSVRLLLSRFLYFGHHFFISDFRWIPIALGTGFLLRGITRKAVAITIALLLCATGAFGGLTTVFLTLFVGSLCYALIRSGRGVNGTALAIGIFPLLLTAFMALVIFTTPTRMTFTFFRYLMPAYPAVITGALWLLFLAGAKRIFYTCATLFIGLTAVSNTGVRYEPFYSETTLAGYAMPLLSIRDAGEWVVEQGNPLLSTGSAALTHFGEPSLGYTTSPVTVVDVSGLPELDRRTYSVVVPPLLPWGDDLAAAMRLYDSYTERGFSLECDTVFVRGPFSSSCFTLRWEDQGDPGPAASSRSSP